MPCCWINFWAHLLSRKKPCKQVAARKGGGPKSPGFFFQVAKKAMVSSIQMDPTRGILGCKWNLIQMDAQSCQRKGGWPAKSGIASSSPSSPSLPDPWNRGKNTKSLWSLGNFSQIFKITLIAFHHLIFQLKYIHFEPTLRSEPPSSRLSKDSDTSPPGFPRLCLGWGIIERVGAAGVCTVLLSTLDICQGDTNNIDENNSNTICLWVSMI